MGRIYANNSQLSLSSIGEGDDALICKTDNEDCCDTPPNRLGEFYYPNGIKVPINKFQRGFYRNRGYQEVYLNKRGGITTPVGVFRCEIPDSDGISQNIYITIN